MRWNQTTMQNLDLVLAALAALLSAITAALGRRNQKQMSQKHYVSPEKTNGLTVKDLIVNVLDEINRMHRRMDKAGIPELERDTDARDNREF